MGSKTSLSSGARLQLPKNIRSFLQPLIERAHKAGAPIYLVGGCVRDLLLGKSAIDLDVVLEGPTGAIAKATARAMKAKLVSHDTFMTHTLSFPKGIHLDIATARTETYPEPAMLPVVQASSLQDDLFRRDFSINAIALSLNEPDFGHLWDAFGGVEDLRAKRLRVLHGESFNDDPTRIFRAARFAGRLGYTLDWRTREWLAESVSHNGPAKLSGARLREELLPILQEVDPRPALSLLCEWGALGFLLPSLTWEKSHDVLMGQLLKTPKNMDSVALRLLALMHAMPVTKAVGGLGHLMFPQKTISQVEAALHLLSTLRSGDATLQKLKSSPKSGISAEVKYFIDKAIKLKVISRKTAAADAWMRLESSTPCLGGRDLESFGYKPGPIFSRILNALREARWEGKLRTREEEVRFVRQVFPIHG